MENALKKNVGQMVAEDYKTAAVFEKYSIDFCCNGGRTLEAACAEHGVDPAPILEDLAELAETNPGNSFRPADWEIDLLADYIVSNHHRYVRRMVPVLEAHLEKIVSVHGSRHPELQAIAERFREISQELAVHMQKEEMVLFPYIKNLAAAGRGEGTVPVPHFGTIRNPIRMMEAEHRSAGDGFAQISGASANYTAPQDACTTYRVTYQELQEFEQDLHQHVHLENNILFPRAIALEDKIKG